MIQVKFLVGLDVVGSPQAAYYGFVKYLSLVERLSGGSPVSLNGDARIIFGSNGHHIIHTVAGITAPNDDVLGTDDLEDIGEDRDDLIYTGVGRVAVTVLEVHGPRNGRDRFVGDDVRPGQVVGHVGGGSISYQVGLVFIQRYGHRVISSEKRHAGGGRNCHFRIVFTGHHRDEVNIIVAKAVLLHPRLGTGAKLSPQSETTFERNQTLVVAGGEAIDYLHRKV